MSRTIQLRTKTDLQALTQVLAWFEQLYVSYLPSRVWLGCKTALAEAFTNAVRHAHRDLSPDTEIELTATLTDQALSIYIWDRGMGFDLQQKLATLNDPLDLEATHGRGLFLLKQLADEITYERMPDGRNCLCIVKQYLPTT